MSKNHVTDSCGNIFLDLGFSEEEAEKLFRESEKRIADERARSINKKGAPGSE